MFLNVVLKRSDDEEWLFVVDGHTCPKAGIGRLDISVAVVDPNDHGRVLCGVAVGIVEIGKHISIRAFAVPVMSDKVVDRDFVEK